MLTPKDKHKFSRKTAARILLASFVSGAFLFGGNILAPVVYAAEAPAGLTVECPTLDNCGIVDLVILIINILSALVGVIVVIMVVLGGIQYASARDNSQAVAAARERIINALLALVFYLGITAFLQWVVPGGVFSG